MFYGSSIFYNKKLTTLISSSNNGINHLNDFYDTVTNGFTDKYSLNDIDILLGDDDVRGLSLPVYLFYHKSNDEQYRFCTENDIRLSSKFLLIEKQQEMNGLIEKLSEIEEGNIDSLGKTFNQLIDSNVTIEKLLGLDKNDEWDTDRDSKTKKHDKAMKKALQGTSTKKKRKKDDLAILSGEISAKRDANGKITVTGTNNIVFDKNTKEVDESVVEKIKRKRMEENTELDRLIETGEILDLFKKDVPNKVITTADKN